MADDKNMNEQPKQLVWIRAFIQPPSSEIERILPEPDIRIDVDDLITMNQDTAISEQSVYTTNKHNTTQIDKIDHTNNNANRGVVDNSNIYTEDSPTISSATLQRFILSEECSASDTDWETEREHAKNVLETFSVQEWQDLLILMLHERCESLEGGIGSIGRIFDVAQPSQLLLLLNRFQNSHSLAIAMLRVVVIETILTAKKNATPQHDTTDKCDGNNKTREEGSDSCLTIDEQSLVARLLWQSGWISLSKLEFSRQLHELSSSKYWTESRSTDPSNTNRARVVQLLTGELTRLWISNRTI